MREDNKVSEAVPFAERLYESSMDECRFQMFASETVAMAARFDLARKFLAEIKVRWGNEDGISQKVRKISLQHEASVREAHTLEQHKM